MAENQSMDDLYGHKVFFLNPDNNTRREIIPQLQEAEYEVYVIESYKDAIVHIRKNPSSILFIGIDNQLTKKGWFNFIKAIQSDEKLYSTSIGILSGHLKGDEEKFFVAHANLKAGVVDTYESNDKMLEKIKEILDGANAKGRRQFVRADCKNDPEAKLLWNTGTKMHVLKIQDISSVGLAAIGPAQFLQVLQKGSVLRGLSVMLNGKQHGLEATVFAIKPYGTEFCMLILLFLKTTPTVTKDNIRQYVVNTLQQVMTDSVSWEKKDAVQYNTLSYWDEAANGNATSTPANADSSPQPEEQSTQYADEDDDNNEEGAAPEADNTEAK